MDITADYKKANAYTLKCMCVSLIVMVVAWTLNILKIFIIDQTIMNRSLTGVIIFIACAFLVKLILGFERPVSNYLMLFLFVGMITFVNMLLSYHVTLFMLFPMVCAILYNKTRYIRYTFVLVCIGFLSSVLVGYSIGLCDANMLVLTTSTHDKEAARLIAGEFEINSNYVLLALFFVLPRIMAFFAFTSVVQYLKKSIQEKTLHEQQSRQLAESERLANQAKSRFLAQMSHEIRTPINAVLGMNEMILHKAKDEEILDYSRNINTAGNTLLVLINSILDFSKIEEGKMEIVPVTYDTRNLINNIISSVEERARSKKLDLIIDVDKNLPMRMVGDDVRLAQVAANLMTNAVKYTEKGHVRFIIREEKKIGRDIDLYVAVEDTGIGIRKEDLPKLFESFSRLDQEKNHSIEGTGLGMPIVTSLLKMMGSEIKIESEYGSGSTFYFVIRQKIFDPTPIGDFTRTASTGGVSHESLLPHADRARVLVVDDNEMNLKVAKNLLGLFGINADLCSSGFDAIDMVKREQYQLILLDHMMPKLDGKETLERMKAENLIFDDTKVVALTANAINGAKEDYLNSGFDDYLSKPIEMDDLKKVLQKWLPDEVIKADEPEESDDEVLEFAPDAEADEDAKEDGGTSFIDLLKEKGFDTGKGISYCAGDTGFYKEMLTDYVNDYAEKKSELDKSFDSEDWHDFEIKVHALKSVSKTIGAIPLSEAAFELEKAASKKDIDYLGEEYETFMKSYAQVVEDIKKAVE